MIKVGDHFWIYIPATGKKEIAICINIDKDRLTHQGVYKFVYSHWGYDGYNFLTKEYIENSTNGFIPFTKADYILYGRKDF